MVSFELESVVRAAPERAFEVSLDIDAHQASMAASDERAVAGVTAGQIGLGEFVTWKAKHFGITWKMTSRITALERPSRFVDEQVRGPFKAFHHVHEFAPHPEGTAMRDTVTFTAPFGPLGRLVEKLVLGRYLRHLIEVRNTFVRTECERTP